MICEQSISLEALQRQLMFPRRRFYGMPGVVGDRPSTLRRGKIHAVATPSTAELLQASGASIKDVPLLEAETPFCFGTWSATTKRLQRKEAPSMVVWTKECRVN
jgi:hypothetical protein